MRRDALERIFINLEKEVNENMLWKRREATEMSVMNFKKELQKKHALEEEGSFREDFHQFRIRIEEESIEIQRLCDFIATTFSWNVIQSDVLSGRVCFWSFCLFLQKPLQNELLWGYDLFPPGMLL